MKSLAIAVAMLAATVARAAEPDGLILPPGFHATVVATGITGLRHLAVRANGDIYVSTRVPRDGKPGIVALELGPDGKVARTERFGDVSNGTGIRFHDGALYASSLSAVYRYTIPRDALVPVAPPEPIVDGLPSTGQVNHPLAFDDRGGLFVVAGSSGNICAPTPAGGAKPVGSMPCPDLATRAGIWRFDSRRTGQKLLVDGERWATGVRDIAALDLRPGDALYGAANGRNGIAASWPEYATLDDDDAIADEMFRIKQGADLGWPYTYYDERRHVRLKGMEYGGDGKTQPPPGVYSDPVVAFPGHSAPLDLLFYQGRQFPSAYRGGAFVALHGALGPERPAGLHGYTIAFVPFDRAGKAGQWRVFADGFAGPTPASRATSRAAYRPIGLAVAPDGALYVGDSNKGRIWRISYDGKG